MSPSQSTLHTVPRMACLLSLICLKSFDGTLWLSPTTNHTSLLQIRALCSGWVAEPSSWYWPADLALCKGCRARCAPSTAQSCLTGAFLNCPLAKQHQPAPSLEGVGVMHPQHTVPWWHRSSVSPRDRLCFLSVVSPPLRNHTPRVQTFPQLFWFLHLCFTLSTAVQLKIKQEHSAYD